MEPEPEHEASSISFASYVRLLRENRNFRRLWLAQIVSEIVVRASSEPESEAALEVGFLGLERRRLENEIRAIPGVVGTGLFLGMADTVLVGDRNDFRMIEERQR